MHISYWAVLVAGVLPVISIGIAKAHRGYDNNDPRTWLERQQGFRKRADYAHRNHFEAFPFFAAAVLVAQQVQVAQSGIDQLAIIFVLARIAYTIFYIANYGVMRSLAWFVGYGCILGLFLRAAQV